LGVSGIVQFKIQYHQRFSDSIIISYYRW